MISFVIFKIKSKEKYKYNNLFFLILIFFSLHSISYCKLKNLFIDDKDIEEIKLKEQILSLRYSTKDEYISSLEKFILKYPFSTFSYYILEILKERLNEDKDKDKVNFVLNNYKLNDESFYMKKNHNKFFYLKSLKNLFYLNLDRDISLKIAREYNKNKNYERAKEFYLFSNLSKINLKEIYKDKELTEKITHINNEIHDSYIKFNNKEALIKEANVCFSLKKFDIARTYYKKILIDQSKDLSKKDYKVILIRLGEIAFLNNKYKEASKYLKSYEKVVRLEEKFLCLYYLGLCYYNTNRPDKALYYFENLKKFYPFTIWEKKASIYIDRIKSEVLDPND